MKMPQPKLSHIALFAAMAISENAMADYLSGLEYLNSKNYGAALREFTESSRAGDARATYQLGKLYLGGLGVKKDTSKAIEYFDAAFLSFQIQISQAKGSPTGSEERNSNSNSNSNASQSRVGQQVCRNGTLTYSYQPMFCNAGNCTYANMRFDSSANDGQIVGSVEQVSTDGSRLQIRISHYASNSMKLKEKKENILSAPILDNEIEASRGRVIWDNSAKWFDCN
jgi:hypothetical protein